MSRQEENSLDKTKVYLDRSKVCDGLGVFALTEIKKGEIILEFKGEKINKPNEHALQINENLWLGPSGSFDDYLNHSCEPNAYVKWGDRISLVALKNIEKGEEIYFNYNTTEYDLGEFSFECGCRSQNCYKYISGFKYLPLEEKLKLKGFLSPFLSKKLKEIIIE